MKSRGVYYWYPNKRRERRWARERSAPQRAALQASDLLLLLCNLELLVPSFDAPRVACECDIRYSQVPTPLKCPQAFSLLQLLRREELERKAS